MRQSLTESSFFVLELQNLSKSRLSHSPFSFIMCGFPDSLTTLQACYAATRLSGPLPFRVHAHYPQCFSHPPSPHQCRLSSPCQHHTPSPHPTSINFALTMPLVSTSLASTRIHQHLRFSRFRPSSCVLAHSGTCPLLPRGEHRPVYGYGRTPQTVRRSRCARTRIRIVV